MAGKKKSGLSTVFGEDIDSLLSDIGEKQGSGSSTDIRIREIRANPYQPRKVFDDTALKELSDSIREHGVFQPIIVRKSLKGYELIAGERRLRASKLAGLDTIPAIIVEIDDREMMEVSLLENIQREDLSVMEEAAGYQQLIDKLGYTQEELSKRVGKSRTHVTNILRMLKAPEAVKRLLEEGKISFGHARVLLSIEDEDYQEELGNKAAKEGLQVVLFEKEPGYVKTRGMYIQYPGEYCSRYATNEKALLKLIRTADGLNPVDRECMDYVADACDGHSCERICELIKKMI